MVGRDEKGRFKPGNKCGRGRPPKTEEQEIVSALEGALPLSEALGLLAAAARRGEDWAIKLYLAYRWHLPTQPVKNDVSGDLRVVVVYDQDGDDTSAETASGATAGTG